MVKTDPVESSGACAAKYGWDGEGQYFKVQPQRPLVDVLHIQLHPLLKWNRITAVHLPQTSDSRFNAEAAALPILMESLVIAYGKRAGAHQAHIALQNIPQLREFIEL